MSDRSATDDDPGGMRSPRRRSPDHRIKWSASSLLPKPSTGEIDPLEHTQRLEIDRLQHEIANEKSILHDKSYQNSDPERQQQPQQPPQQKNVLTATPGPIHTPSDLVEATCL